GVELAAPHRLPPRGGLRLGQRLGALGARPRGLRAGARGGARLARLLRLARLPAALGDAAALAGAELAAAVDGAALAAAGLALRPLLAALALAAAGGLAAHRAGLLLGAVLAAGGVGAGAVAVVAAGEHLGRLPLGLAAPHALAHQALAAVLAEALRRPRGGRPLVVGAGGLAVAALEHPGGPGVVVGGGHLHAVGAQAVDHRLAVTRP